jgi:hypothetical protein
MQTAKQPKILLEEKKEKSNTTTEILNHAKAMLGLFDVLQILHFSLSPTRHKGRNARC